MRVRGALVVSLALHAAVLAALLLIPEPPSPPRVTPQWTAVEWVTVPPPKPKVEAPAPTAEPTPSQPHDSSDAPVPSDSPPAPRARRRRSGSAPSEAGALGPAEDQPVVVPGPAEPRPGGLSLSMRGAPQASTGRLAPRLSPADRAPRQPDDDVLRTPADAGFVRAGKGRWIYRNPDPKAAWKAELLPDGRMHFSDPPLSPCRSSQCWLPQKQRLLKRTFALRLRKAKAFARKNIERQLQRLRGDLTAIWTSDRPPHTRRALIFERWDECEESVEIDLGEFDDQTSEIDALRANAGDKARSAIIAFIRTHIPKDGPDRYTKAEVLAMNQRRHSTQRFSPYGA